MSIPASEIVSTAASTLGSFGNSLSLDGLFLSDCPCVETNTILAFSNMEEVAEFFPAASDEYRAAVTYFAGFTSSAEKPALFQIFRYDEDAEVAGFLRGDRVHDIYTEIGDIAITIDGDEIICRDIDFSEAASQEEVAQILEDALNGSSPKILQTAEAAWVPGGDGTRSLVYPDSRYGLLDEPSLIAFSVASNDLLCRHLSLELPDGTYGSNSYNGFVPLWIISGSQHENYVFSQASSWMHEVLGEAGNIVVNYVDLEFATAYLLCQEGALESADCNFKIWWLA